MKSYGIKNINLKYYPKMWVKIGMVILIYDKTQDEFRN